MDGVPLNDEVAVAVDDTVANALVEALRVPVLADEPVLDEVTADVTLGVCDGVPVCDDVAVSVGETVDTGVHELDGVTVAVPLLLRVPVLLGVAVGVVVLV